MVLRQKAAVFVRRTKGKLLQRAAMFPVVMTKDIRNKKRRKKDGVAGVVLRQKAAVFVRRTKGKLLQRAAMFPVEGQKKKHANRKNCEA